jgi:hypothetical protein
MTDGAPQPSSPHERLFSSEEVAGHLNLSADALQRMSARFSRYLSSHASQEAPAYTNADIAALVAVQKLLAQGYNDDQVNRYLTPLRMEDSAHAAPALAHTANGQDAPTAGDSFLPVLSEILNTIVSNQEALLNAQATLREMANVVVQDNFNLKDDNRKLRERMLELERVLAEYQRREETRKERLESRLRAVEGTVGALQQQLAQLVQLYRTQSKRGGWFG